MGSPLGPGFPYKNESMPGLQFNIPGRLAMANSGPNTNGSQFFITEAPYPSLNGGYTIWGQCDNVDVVKAITHVPRDANDKPKTPVHIKHVLVERVGPAPAGMPPEAMPARPAFLGNWGLSQQVPLRVPRAVRLRRRQSRRTSGKRRLLRRSLRL